VLVRAATPTGARSIASVHVESWQTAYRGQLPDHVLDTLSVDRRTAMWSDMVAASEPGSAILLLERDGVVEGFSHVCAARGADAGPGVGEVSAIYLRPAIWGRGFGGELMEAALRHLAATGFTSAILWVLATNHRARRFYEAGGWRRDGTARTEEIAGARVDEVRYRHETGGERAG
jgi:RimJ/RimL family protein N-acetyltransferase